MKINLTKQPVLNIGLVGHIDHGKTTLLYQLTGKWADTHSEELKRGITIKLGYADVIIRKCPSCGKYTIKEKCECHSKTEAVKYVSFVDAPGHEMLMATMLSGAAIIDAAILVIAANEPCPRPQTKEHLVGLEAKNVKDIIIVQNKVDLVTKEQALKNYMEIKNFVRGTIAENSLIIPISAQQGINIDALLEAIDHLKIPKRDTASDPIFFVARSFDVNKPGTEIKNLSGGVVGGILKQGKLKIGDKIEIKPGEAIKKHNVTEYKTLKTKIISLRSGKNELKEAFPSGSLAIETSLDPRITKSDGLVGCVISSEKKLPEITDRIKIKVHLFKEKEVITKIEKLKTAETLLLSINTSITLGNVTKIKKDEAELKLKIPIVPIKNSRIGIARNIQGKWRLIGWAELL